MFKSFDFQNIVVDNISTYTNVLAVLSGWNYCMDMLFPKNDLALTKAAVQPPQKIMLNVDRMRKIG